MRERRERIWEEGGGDENKQEVEVTCGSKENERSGRSESSSGGATCCIADG